MNGKNLGILKKVVDAGFTNEQAIADMTAEDMTTFCRTIAEITAVIELQKAVKSGKLIAYLAKDETK